MISVTECAEEFNAIPTANVDKTLFFSRELAVKINPKRPDITAALILYGLYLWQKVWIPSFKYVPMVNGQRGSYQSLSELQINYPWLTEEAIRLAIGRAEKALKGQFVVDRGHPEADRGKLHFWISPALTKKYRFNADKKMGLLQFQSADALEHGVLEAILLSNLKYVTDEEHNRFPLRDSEGNIYRELSPTKLTKERLDKNGIYKKILPYSRKAVSEALSNLKAEQIIIEHPSKTGFFRRNEPSETVTKVADAVTKVARRVTKLASHDEVMPRNNRKESELCNISETSNTNTSSNPNSKCILPSTAELRSSVNGFPSEWSSGARKLMELVQKEMELHRQRLAKSSPCIILDSEEFCEASSFECPMSGIAIDATHMAEEELHSCILVKDHVTGKLYNRPAEIDWMIDEAKLLLQVVEMPSTTKDLKDLRELLKKHDNLHYDHIEEMIGFALSWRADIFGNPIPPSKKGHDTFFWARRTSDLRTFLRYLPQLVRSMWELTGDEMEYDAKTGKPIFDYSEMPEPYMSLAFLHDTTHQITRTNIDPNDWESEKRPVYYAEFVGLPTVEIVEYEYNPVAA